MMVTMEYKGISDLVWDASMAFISTTFGVIVSLGLLERVDNSNYDWIVLTLYLFAIIFFFLRAIWSFVILFMKLNDKRIKNQTLYMDHSRVP